MRIKPSEEDCVNRDLFVMATSVKGCEQMINLLTKETLLLFSLVLRGTTALGMHYAVFLLHSDNTIL